jgi:hypothetical protein
MRILPWTRLTFFNFSFWFPIGIHYRSLEYIELFDKYYYGFRFLDSISSSVDFLNCSFLLQMALSRNFRLFYSFVSSSSFLYLKSLQSTLIGSNPNRWTSSSSGNTDVFWNNNTLWNAIVGTSAIIILRRAFAIAASIPLMSNYND